MSSKKNNKRISPTVAATTVGLTIVPSSVLGKSFGHTAPSDKLNIAGVGVGGKGFSVLKSLESENIVALADVDWKYSKPTFDYFPNAKKYVDYRKMYDELGKSIDAVMVATPDHTHAIIAADAITMGKH
ncbi:MAG TPA: Gfo/Idh/MocA family oxidoreductase, partial [Marinilabiliaceae bacterium]|nr:Gfo/Idh/MocA family oxidoreductase [Marinilabiliaceae bacterium]